MITDNLLLWVFGVLLLVYLAYLVSIRLRRDKNRGFEYVYVNDDGSARELDTDEIEYLSTDFLGGDGDRPYIKADYETLTPDGKIRGYLWRSRLPANILVAPAPAPAEKNSPSPESTRKT